MKWLLAILFALRAVPALAQTTNCMTAGQQTYCNTTPSGGFNTYTPPLVTPSYGVNSSLMGLLMARRQAQIEAQREQEREQEQAADRLDIANFHQRLGALIEAGKCDEARNTALYAGRLDDAALVNQACTAPAPPTGPK